MVALAKQPNMWNEPVQVKHGDIYQLDRHRIACLDAFDPITFEVLLEGKRPHAIITDPPYGMRLDTDFESMRPSHTFREEKGVTGGRKYVPVHGDEHDFNAAFFTSLFQDVPEQFWFGANYYAVTLGNTMHSGSWLVWDKRELENFDKMFGSCFELIWSRKKHKQDILRHRWAGVFGTEHEVEKCRSHPTQKPLPLIEDIIMRYTKPGQYILDFFLGSGTSIIAAERMGRTAYGCELSPEYCEIAIQRWQNLTGQQARRVEVN